MTSIIKDVMTNVEIVDKETKEVLFIGHNIFTNLGKKFLRDVMNGLVLDISPGLPTYAAELGNPSPVTAPSYSDTNIELPLSPPVNISLNSKSTTDLTTSSFQIEFVFDYTNGSASAIDFTEIGLFYRPGASYPDVTGTNILLARLRTTYNKVSVGINRTIQITWKVLF